MMGSAGKLIMDSTSNKIHCESGFHLLDAEIMRMSSEENKDYIDAKATAPELIERESDPLVYLTSCKHDAPKAAKRLAFYWKLRKEAFQERAFLPLDQTGKGALSEEDIKLLKCGAYAVLPNGTVYINRWRFSKSSYKNRHARFRCLFYVLSLAMAHRRKVKLRPMGDNLANKNLSGENALINLKFLHLLNDTSAVKLNVDHFDFYVPRKLEELVMKALPTISTEVHFVSLPFADEELQSAAMSAYRSLVGKLTSFLLVMVGKVHGHSTVHHHGSTSDYILQSLKQHGFCKRTLPDCMGGKWSYETHKQYLYRQLRSEESRRLSEDEKLKRKRNVSRIHSRQKRARRRIEIEVLVEQQAELLEQNEKLRAENKKLEGYIQACINEVTSLESGSRTDRPSDISSSSSGIPISRVDVTTLQSRILQELRQQQPQYPGLLESWRHSVASSNTMTPHFTLQGLQRGADPSDGQPSMKLLNATGTIGNQTITDFLCLFDRTVASIETNREHSGLLELQLHRSEDDIWLTRSLLETTSPLPQRQPQQMLLEAFQLRQQPQSQLVLNPPNPLQLSQPLQTEDSLNLLRSLSSALKSYGNPGNQTSHSLAP